MASSTATPTKPAAAKDYKSDVQSDWCPGCGDFGIVAAVQGVYAELGIPNHQIISYSGVGCSSKSPHFMQTYGVHTLHGRSLPFALGTALANPDVKVVVTGGDGDGYGIGAGHFMHAGRRNVDITYLVYNNEVYGLTKGQASPTLAFGQQPKSLPVPNPNDGVDPLALAINAGYTFVARSYAYNRAHLMATIKRAMQHRGMAIVDILQPCPTYNNLHTKDWYGEEIELSGAMFPRVYDIEAEGYNGMVQNPNDADEVNRKEIAALTKIRTKEDRVAIGVFWQIEKPTFMDRITQGNPLLAQTPSYKMAIADAQGNPTTDLSATYAEFLTTA
ncbi:MAG: thiamine pyrophosphate-dependent enzyme [Vampirovibrionales bacterium]